MLRSLLKGVGMGAGMSVGQQVTGAIIQNVTGGRRNRNNNNAANNNNTAAARRPRDIRCGSCNEMNTSDSRFCGECGNCLVTRYNLSSGVTCACGYVNAQGQKFCSECGQSLR
jgi:membrane protease subunit (stomatin/prohibitin family)